MFFTTKAKPLHNYEPKTIMNNPSREKMCPQTPCRILISAPTGGGKTNLLLNLIYDMLPWSSLYIYAKDINEPKYQELREACDGANEIKPFNYVFASENIVNVDELDSSEHNLIIFDDFVTDKESIPKITSLFVRGRKKNATIIYLTQSYYATPKIIRLQCNHFCIFKPSDDREIGELHKNHNCGMKRQDFLVMFHEATSTPYSFFYLDINNPERNLQCRKNFTGKLNLNFDKNKK